MFILASIKFNLYLFCLNSNTTIQSITHRITHPARHPSARTWQSTADASGMTIPMNGLLGEEPARRERGRRFPSCKTAELLSAWQEDRVKLHDRPIPLEGIRARRLRAIPRPLLLTLRHAPAKPAVHHAPGSPELYAGDAGWLPASMLPRPPASTIFWRAHAAPFSPRPARQGRPAPEQGLRKEAP